MQQVKILGYCGNYYRIYRVYDVDGLCPALITTSGGGHEPKFLVEVEDDRQAEDKTEL